MQIRVAVIGAGSWGTTVAHLTAHNAPTVLWARDEVVAGAVDTGKGNPKYLAGFDLHPDLRATADLAEAVRQADVLVMGVPSHSFRSTLEAVSDHVRAWVPVISLTKGLEQGTKLRMTQVIREVLPGHPYGVLTGPNLAKEILAGDAAATVIAASDDNVAARLQDVFATDLFRVYTNRDIVGCELGGALKNVMAIASGMADGLGTGDNTRAAVITRGLAELSRLGLAMGGELITFGGLAGMGDLLATCISPQSRNRFVGVELGKGRTIDEIIEQMNMVAEGVKTSSVVMELARERDVEMPIAEQVYAVINEGRSAAEAYRGLLGRRTQAEMHDMRA
ncbi:MAG: NAD(P)H-dependent glycerol-3-phosphate dehydrogenase [Acidimicrobiales bacterium]